MMHKEGKDSLTLVATGDSLITRRMSVYGETDMVRIIRNADVSFTNCEITIHDFKGYPETERGPTSMVAESHIAEELRWIGFNIVSRANNHCWDYGPEGLFATSENLQRAGLVHAGAGKNLGEARSPAFLDTAKGRVALISAYAIELGGELTQNGMAGETRPDIQGRPGFNPLRYELYHLVEPELINSLKEVSDKLEFGERYQTPHWLRSLPVDKRPKGFWFLRKRFADAGGEPMGIRTEAYGPDREGNLKWIRDAAGRSDFVIVGFHSHAHSARPEVPDQPGSFLQPFARASIDAGADAFIGHGPHVLHGIEIYKGKPILYSLGNFILQHSALKKVPADIYEEYGLGLDATPFDYARARIRPLERHKGAAWESVIAQCRYEESRLAELNLYPINLDESKLDQDIGTPKLADENRGRKIIERLQKLSDPYGTEIIFDHGVGRIKIGKETV